MGKLTLLFEARTVKEFRSKYCFVQFAGQEVVHVLCMNSDQNNLQWIERSLKRSSEVEVMVWNIPTVCLKSKRGPKVVKGLGACLAPTQVVSLAPHMISVVTKSKFLSADLGFFSQFHTLPLFLKILFNKPLWEGKWGYWWEKLALTEWVLKICIPDTQL